MLALVPSIEQAGRGARAFTQESDRQLTEGHLFTTFTSVKIPARFYQVIHLSVTRKEW